MIRNLFAAALLCLVASCSNMPAFAGPRDAHYSGCNITMPCDFDGAAISVPRSSGSGAAQHGSAGISGPLAAKAYEIIAACGGHLGDNDGHSVYVHGTNRVSLHKSNQAIDIFAPSGCVYGHLQGWPGGYSVDPGIGHVHVSFTHPGGPEWGARFVHRGHARKHRRRS